MTDILIVENLVKHYPIRKGVSRRRSVRESRRRGFLFDTRGKTLGLVGESGCGKTTAGARSSDCSSPLRARNVRRLRRVSLGGAELRKLRRQMRSSSGPLRFAESSNDMVQCWKNPIRFPESVRKRREPPPDELANSREPMIPVRTDPARRRARQRVCGATHARGPQSRTR